MNLYVYLLYKEKGANFSKQINIVTEQMLRKEKIHFYALYFSINEVAENWDAQRSYINKSV